MSWRCHEKLKKAVHTTFVFTAVFFLVYDEFQIQNNVVLYRPDAHTRHPTASMPNQNISKNVPFASGSLSGK